jgi:hypothetical protein
LSGVPIRGKLIDRQPGDSKGVRHFHGRNDIVIRQFVGISKDLKRTESTARRCVNYWCPLVVPTPSVQTCAQAIVRGIAAAPEAVDQHLPNAVLHAA